MISFSTSERRLKVTVVTPRYSISGVPLAQTRFARALASKGHDVEFIIGRMDDGLNLPQIPGAKVKALGLPNVRSMFFPIWEHLRNAKPEIIFSAEDHLNTLILMVVILSGSRVKVSGSSRVTPFDTYSNRIFTKR